MAREIVIISDGAVWIENLVREMLPGKTECGMISIDKKAISSAATQSSPLTDMQCKTA